MKYIRKKKASQNFIKEKVKNFFEENSCIDPSKKACKKIDGIQVNKRYLNANILDLHAKFCAENCFKVSYANFAKLRPSYCVAPKVTQRDTCACYHHENFSLLTASLHRIKVIKENTSLKIIASVTCDERREECLSRTCEKCKNKQILFNNIEDRLEEEMFYMKWETSTEQRINEKTKKPITVTITSKKKKLCKLNEAIELFKNELDKFLEHEFRILHQKTFMKNLTKNISNEEIVVLMDFSENYSCKYSTEVQSVHFGASRSQITLHTGILYAVGRTEGFCTLSKSLRHDPVAVTAHIIKILDLYLSQFLPQRYSQLTEISYNFSEAGHGKSPADGIGGSLKKMADEKVKYGQDIPDFETLVSILHKSVKSIHIDVVKKKDIETLDAVLPEELKTFKGTMKMHQYTWTKSQPKTISFRLLSYSECSTGVKCKHFFIADQDFLDFSAKETKSIDKKSARKKNYAPALSATSEAIPRTRSKRKQNDSVNLIHGKRTANSKEEEKSKNKLRRKESAEKSKKVSV